MQDDHASSRTVSIGATQEIPAVEACGSASSDDSDLDHDDLSDVAVVLTEEECSTPRGRGQMDAINKIMGASVHDAKVRRHIS